MAHLREASCPGAQRFWTAAAKRVARRYLAPSKFLRGPSSFSLPGNEQVETP